MIIHHAYLLITKSKQVSSTEVVSRSTKNNSVSQVIESRGAIQSMSHTPHLSDASSSRHDIQEDLTPGVKSLLLEQLHDDIARHLLYPDAAVTLDLSGRVTLKFLLLPSGVIQQVSVLRSSGSPILDNAAMLTLAKVSPFMPATHYLHQADCLTIPVSFEMQ